MTNAASLDEDLAKCEIVESEVVTTNGAIKIYHLKLGAKLIEIGPDQDYAERFAFLIKMHVERSVSWTRHLAEERDKRSVERAGKSDRTSIY